MELADHLQSQVVKRFEQKDLTEQVETPSDDGVSPGVPDSGPPPENAIAGLLTQSFES